LGLVMGACRNNGARHPEHSTVSFRAGYPRSGYPAQDDGVRFTAGRRPPSASRPC
jgi:hypothetical protein